MHGRVSSARFFFDKTLQSSIPSAKSPDDGKLGLIPSRLA
jgi:hypothetical protein